MAAVERVKNKVMVHTTSGDVVFSSRGFEVLETLADHPTWTNETIARHLNLSLSRVNNLLSEIYQKLELNRSKVTQRGELVKWYNENVRSDPEEQSKIPVLSESVPLVLKEEQIEYSALPKIVEQKREFEDPQRVYLAILFSAFVFTLIYVFLPDNPFDSPDNLHLRYSSPYPLVPLLGGTLGLYRIRRAKQFFGQARYPKNGIEKICLGIILWAIGGLVWFFYNPTGVELPYPFFVRLFYLAAISLIAWGSKTTFSIPSKSRLVNSVILLILAVAVLVFELATFLLPLHEHLFFSVFSPAADIVVFAILLLFSEQLSPSDVDTPAENLASYLLVGIVAYFLGDLNFSLSIPVPAERLLEFPNINRPNFQFLSSLFIMSVGILLMDVTPDSTQ
jgi:DNA-binding CsgD family transcriptional regulator